MNLTFKCLPFGALPYTNENVTARMMMKLFENSPYLPLFPLVDKNDTLLNRTLGNLSDIVLKEDEEVITFKIGINKLIQKFETAYNKPTKENLEPFSINSFFLNKYLEMVKNNKPKEAIIDLYGPFSILQIIQSTEVNNATADINYRNFVTEICALKAFWFINKIGEISPDTTPVIIFHENKFNLFGAARRENHDITAERIISFYSTIFSKIHEYGGAVGIHSYNKCDWQIPIDAGVDLISFDAYNNPNNLNIIAEKVKKFLSKGGYINWGMIPTQSESVIKSTGIEAAVDRFLRTTEMLIDEKVSPKLLYSRSKVSVASNLDHLPLIFAEKALILSTQLAKRIPKRF